MNFFLVVLFHLLTINFVSDVPTSFKHIPSPVGLYIKHSPIVPLKKKHEPKAGKPMKKAFKKTCSENKENTDDFDIPYVSYKPSKNREVLDEVYVYQLPKSIEKMMHPEPLIEKHTVRIKAREDKESVQRRLAMADLTTSLSDTTLLETSSGIQDLSVIAIKHTYK